MNNLQQEAEEYANKFRFISETDSWFNNKTNSFIAGANSKYVNAQIIQAKIDGLSLASENALGIIYRMQELEEQLKQLKNDI